MLEHPGISIRGKGMLIACKCKLTSNAELTIFIEAGSVISHCTINVSGHHNQLHIPSTVNLHDVTFTFEDDNNQIKIGKYTSIEGRVEFCACESKHIIVGEGCMFSHDISVRTTDSHPILDAEGKRINEAQDVVIGNRVWVGFQSVILKGVSVPDDCIIGARSVLTSSIQIPPHSLIVGQPGMVIRENVTWRRRR